MVELINIFLLLLICLFYLYLLVKANKAILGIAVIASFTTIFINSFPYSIADMLHGSTLTLSVQYVIPSSVFEELARALIGVYWFKVSIRPHSITRKEQLGFAGSVAAIFTGMEKFDTLVFFAFAKTGDPNFDIHFFLLSGGMFLGFATHIAIHFFLVSLSFHFVFQKKWIALTLVGFFHALVNYLMLKTPIYLNDLDSLYLNILAKTMMIVLVGGMVYKVKIYKTK